MWFPDLSYRVKRMRISSCMAKNYTIWPNKIKIMYFKLCLKTSTLLPKKGFKTVEYQNFKLG